MSKGARALPLGRRAGQALAAALLLTAVLLSQRCLQIVVPAAGRCSLATPAAVAAAAAAGSHSEAQPIAAAGGITLGGHERSAGTPGSSSSSVAGGRDAGGTRSSGTGPPSAAHPAAACDLAVEPSQWADSCLLLRDACVDQGSIILYGDEHHMTASSPGLAPYQIVPTTDYRKYIFLHPGSVSAAVDLLVLLRAGLRVCLSLQPDVWPQAGGLHSCCASPTCLLRFCSGLFWTHALHALLPAQSHASCLPLPGCRMRATTAMATHPSVCGPPAARRGQPI